MLGRSRLRTSGIMVPLGARRHVKMTDFDGGPLFAGRLGIRYGGFFSVSHWTNTLLSLS